MLGSIVGQKIAKRMLLNEIKRGLLPQTLLFFGPDGSGKFLTALEISRVVNCNKDGLDDCKCESCRRIRRLNSPNLLILSKSNLVNTFYLWFKYGVDEHSYPFFYRDVQRLILQRKSQIIAKMKDRSDEKIEEKLNEEIGFLRDSIFTYDNFIKVGKKDIFDKIEKILNKSKDNIISIDEIRNIKRFLHHSSGMFKKKIVIIDGAEYMNEEASNSFLKISEDTPENSMIILTTANKKRIKDTIISRARNYRFTELKSDEMKEVLYRLYKRDIFFNVQHVNNERILTILKEIYASRNNFEKIFTLVQNIIKDGIEVDIIDYLKNRYLERLYQNENLTIEAVYELENKLKDLAEEKRKLRSTNVNRELSLSNFIINNILT